MDWSKGFTVRYYVTTVDKETWMDLDKINLESGTISRSLDDLIESADIDCAKFKLSEDTDERWDDERWIRIWIDVRQEDDNYHAPLFTGITSSPQLRIEGTLVKNSLQCYSVLKPAQDVLLPRGYYVREGADGGEEVYHLLRDVIPAPVHLQEGNRNVSNTIIAEDGESNLSMAMKILTNMNWRLRINGSGMVYICPVSNYLTSTYDEVNDSLETNITVECDWYSCPNVFRAVSDKVYAIARDDDKNSRLSTVSRGREVWKEDTSCSLFDGESIAEYATRRLQEEQSLAIETSYSRRFDPDVTVGDIIMLDYPKQGISGYYRVQSQSISLGYSATVSEKSVKYGGVVVDANGRNLQ